MDGTTADLMRTHVSAIKAETAKLLAISKIAGAGEEAKTLALLAVAEGLFPSIDEGYEAAASVYRGSFFPPGAVEYMVNEARANRAAEAQGR